MEGTFTKYLILLFLLTLPISRPSRAAAASPLQKRFTVPRIALNWQNGQEFCRKKSLGNLAAVKTKADAEYVSKLCRIHGRSSCWVGLSADINYMKDYEFVWKWRNGEKGIDLTWANRPTLGFNCAGIQAHSSSFVAEHCLAIRHVVCEKDSVIVVKEKKTWLEAFDHCRDIKPGTWRNTYDMVSLSTEEEVAYAQHIISTAHLGEVWIGLRWVAGRWMWLNRKPETKASMPACPAPEVECGTLSADGRQVRSCEERRNFLCSPRQ